MAAAAVSRALIRAANPTLAIGQIGGHVKRGIEPPIGARTRARMALVSALPLSPDDDRVVLTFLDRSSPVDTFDRNPCSGDNAVIIVPASEIHVSFVKGVCPGDWRGIKVAWGQEMQEPIDLDVDPTGLDLEASDAWVDLVDELGCDCTKWGGYPLWQNAPVDVEKAYGGPLRFHHRIAGDLLDLGLGDGGVLYTFVAEDGSGGAVCWQLAGGGKEQRYWHYQ